MTNQLALLLYQLSVIFYASLIHLAANWNQKAKLMYIGRKRWKQKLEEQLKTIDKPIIWFHCASLGEFEMARPIIEHYHTESTFAIVITFFSASGYEIRKNYSGADIISYLPYDIGNQANDFVSTIMPAKAIFVKYELWLGYIEALNKHKIDAVLIGAHLKSNGIYFRWYGSIYLKALRSFKYIFTQTPEDVTLLQNYQVNNGVCAGDPRYDRVWQNAQSRNENATVSTFVANRPCIVLGSSYKPEEQIVAASLSSLPENVCLIVAPHEVNEERIKEIELTFSLYSTVRYSAMCKLQVQSKVLIIDNVGMLANIYHYGQIAFVGGGFGNKGMHNILEPLAMGCYVLVGPRNHDQFPEVPSAISARVATCIDSHKMLISTLTPLISNYHAFAQLKELSIKYISSQVGASAFIIHSLKTKA